jgi:hypothetical protein
MQAGANFAWGKHAAGTHGDVAIVALFNLQAKQVHKAQLAGDPGAPGYGMQSGAFFSRQWASSL